jgi:hypothetical protein
MLTLAEYRRIGAVTIFRDILLVDGVARFTSIFYAIPDQPRLVIEQDGGAAFYVTWFRGTLAGGVRGGGLATLSLDLMISTQTREELLRQIPLQYGLPAGQGVELRAVPFKAGTVELSFAGERGPGEFVNQIAGSGPARLSGHERATFAMDLTADGVALLWPAVEQKLNAIHIRYDLVYEHRLAGTSMRVWCDAKRSYPRAQAWLGSGQADLGGLSTTLIEERLAGIEVSSDHPIAPEYEQQLQRTGQDILTKALAATILSPEGNAGGRKLRPYSESMQYALNVQFYDSSPLDAHAVLDSLVRIELTDEQFRRRLVQVRAENGFFSLLTVQIVCTVDFSEDLISVVKVVLTTTDRLKRTGEFIFKKGTPETQLFCADLASPSQNEYTYAVEIFYTGDPMPSRVSYGPTNSTVIVLDFDSVGTLNVLVALRNVPFDLVSKAVVALQYPPKGLSRTMVFDGETLSDSWRVVVREGPLTFQYKVDWLLRNGTRVEGDWTPSDRRTLYLDAPPALDQKAKVQVMSAGDFSGLVQIVVDLRSDADHLETQIAFTRAGESRTWELKRQADAELQYAFRRTLVYQDGTVRKVDSDWIPESRTLLVIADDLRFDVHIIARLLDIGGTLKAVIVELESVIAPENMQRKTLLLQNKSEQQRWTFRIINPGQHGYRYRVTAVGIDGQRQKPSEWRDADSELLVLTPTT